MKPSSRLSGTPLSTCFSVSRAISMRALPLICAHFEPEASRMMMARSAATAGSDRSTAASRPADRRSRERIGEPRGSIVQQARFRDTEAVALVIGLAGEPGARRGADEPVEMGGIAVGKDVAGAAAGLLAGVLGQHGGGARAKPHVDVAGRDAVAAELGAAVDRGVGAGAAARRIQAADIARRHDEADLPVGLGSEVLLAGMGGRGEGAPGGRR